MIPEGNSLFPHDPETAYLVGQNTSALESENVCVCVRERKKLIGSVEQCRFHLSLLSCLQHEQSSHIYKSVQTFIFKNPNQPATLYFTLSQFLIISFLC